jgi:hypothetical protein
MANVFGNRLPPSVLRWDDSRIFLFNKLLFRGRFSSAVRQNCVAQCKVLKSYVLLCLGLFLCVIALAALWNADIALRRVHCSEGRKRGRVRPAYFGLLLLLQVKRVMLEIGHFFCLSAFFGQLFIDPS